MKIDGIHAGYVGSATPVSEAGGHGAVHDPRIWRLVGGLTGLLAILGNVLGVAFLSQSPSAYRVAKLESWVSESLATPWATSASAIAFTLGLLALAAWARELGRAAGGALAAFGANVIVVAALFNAAGTLTPLVLVAHVGDCGGACDAMGRGLLGFTLAMDALFNLGLGLGLLLLAFGARSGGRALRWLMAVAGALCLPVSAQVVWDPAASLCLSPRLSGCF